MKFQNKFNLAVEQYQTGNLQQAETICYGLLQGQSHNAEVTHFPGLVRYGFWTVTTGVPDAKLILKAKSFPDSFTRTAALDTFTHAGISAERVKLLPWEPSTSGYLETYNSIDIGLDTYPYSQWTSLN